MDVIYPYSFLQGKGPPFLQDPERKVHVTARSTGLHSLWLSGENENQESQDLISALPCTATFGSRIQPGCRSEPTTPRASNNMGKASLSTWPRHNNFEKNTQQEKSTYAALYRNNFPNRKVLNQSRGWAATLKGIINTRLSRPSLLNWEMPLSKPEVLSGLKLLFPSLGVPSAARWLRPPSRPGSIHFPERTLPS